MENLSKTRKKCPRCGRPVDFSSNPFRPFCSKRCKMADLGAWLKEEYYISSSLFHFQSDLQGEKQAEE
ncbi:MAG: hypothetical protein DSZ23_05890 [Thermodesulfatator sp.]|nr:MAG: hypothetical protein DSZ23_05890 [Thermodesulfatator sp.]